MWKFTADEPVEEELKPCDHPECDEKGQFRAPKSRARLRDYYFFCEEHITEYNRKWNYFDGFTQEQINQQRKKDYGWDRPTWAANAPLYLEKRLRRLASMYFSGQTGGAQNKQQETFEELREVNGEREALLVLGLEVTSDFATIKSQYRTMVKRWHPDRNPDDPMAEDRFKIITEAYSTLKEIHNQT